jgi:hypothetical protein
MMGWGGLGVGLRRGSNKLSKLGEDDDELREPVYWVLLAAGGCCFSSRSRLVPTGLTE